MCDFSEWLEGYSSSHSPDKIMEVGRAVRSMQDRYPNELFGELGARLGIGATETQMKYLEEFSKTKIPTQYGPYFRFGLQVGDIVLWGGDGC